MQYSLKAQVPELFGTFTKILDDSFRHLNLSETSYCLGCLRLEIAEPVKIDEHGRRYRCPDNSCEIAA